MTCTRILPISSHWSSAALAGSIQRRNCPWYELLWWWRHGKRALQRHPDQAFARYITNGLKSGFRDGFRCGLPLRSVSRNMPSAITHPEVVTNYLRKELSLRRMLGPYDSTKHLPPLHVNRFGVIPKGHNTGKWRLITNLSHPEGASVNAGIDPDLCSLTYTTVDMIAEQITLLGKGTLQAKIDIESAYCLIPVHPHYRTLQAMSWGG